MPDNAAHKDLERLVGKARASESVPINSLLQAGAKVTLSSDWDVSNLNPFLGMANSLGRAGESITLKVTRSLCMWPFLTYYFTLTLILVIVLF